VQPARGRERHGGRKAEGRALLRQAVDPELVARVRADDGDAQVVRELTRAPAWSMCACVSQICVGLTPRRRASASSCSMSPPGSMNAASCVASHQTMEQFCWKGVTGRVR